MTAALGNRRVLLASVFVLAAMAVTGLSLRADPPCGNGTVPKSAECESKPGGVFYTGSCGGVPLFNCDDASKWTPYSPPIACGYLQPTPDPNAGSLSRCG